MLPKKGSLPDICLGNKEQVLNDSFKNFRAPLFFKQITGRVWKNVVEYLKSTLVNSLCAVLIEAPVESSRGLEVRTLCAN